MACTGCGSSNCRGCKDIKVILPAGVGIDSITDNGDGNWLITYTDGTTEILPAPASSMLNDDWVSLTESDMTAINFTGTATHNSTAILLKYKILTQDTVVVKGQLTLNVTVTGLSNSVNNNFRFAPFSGSNFFTGTKTFLGAMQRVPITIYTNTATDLPNQKGTAIASIISSQNAISIGETNLQLPNGTYNVLVHFEFLCELT